MMRANAGSSVFSKALEINPALELMEAGSGWKVSAVGLCLGLVTEGS